MAWDPSKGLRGDQCFCPCSIRTEAFTLVLTQSSLLFVEAPGSYYDGLAALWRAALCQGSDSVVTGGFIELPLVMGRMVLGLLESIGHVVCLCCSGISMGLLPRMQPRGFLGLFWLCQMHEPERQAMASSY